VVEHGGDINGFSCDVLRMPEEKILVVVLTNNTRAALPPDAVAHHIARALLGRPTLERRALAGKAPDAKALEAYVGVYRAGGTTRTVTREGDKLLIERAGRAKWELVATGDDTFDYAMTNASIRFSRDAQGKVVGAQVDNYIGPLEPVMARTADPLPAEPKPRS
jgi:hypothetical protein